MNDNEYEGQPQLVYNPYTKTFMDVNFLFEFYESRCQNQPGQLVDMIDDIIRFVGIHFEKDADHMDLRNTIANLYEVKDIFTHLAKSQKIAA